MASAEQRAANRRNAQLSTGPRTEQGRRRSAVNAVRHGLSRPWLSQEEAQGLQAVAALIQDECSNPAQAQELARKIFDYEKSEARQREYLVALMKSLERTQVVISERGLDQASLETSETSEAYAMLKNMLENVQQSPAPLNSREHTKVLQALGDIRDELARDRLQYAQRRMRDWRGSLRYLRRAANQLSKALRAQALRS